MGTPWRGAAAGAAPGAGAASGAAPPGGGWRLGAGTGRGRVRGSGWVSSGSEGAARAPGEAPADVPRHGVPIALDPYVIPLGTRVHVEGYGDAVAGDVGGAIRGRRIDLCVATYEEAMQFGRRTVT